MATPRLRHAFRYPDSDSDSGLPSAIDEQEQSSLIAQLADQDRSTTALFRTAFAALLALATVALLALSNGSRRSASGTALGLAAISSSVLVLLLQTDPSSSDEQRGAADWRSRPEMPVLRRWLPRLNWALAAVLGLRIFARYVVKGAVVGRDLDGAVEALAFGLSFFMPLVRYLLRPVDLSSLTDLKYNYKGA